MAVIPKPAFPNVPQLPGVPQLPRSPNVPVPVIQSLGVAAIAGRLWQAVHVKPTWGVFDSSGNLVLEPDSIVDFAFRNEWSLPTFPIQGNAFANYNKVATPFEIPLRVSIGGSQTRRAFFLNQLESIAKTLELYTILTPEKTYTRANITRYEIVRRGAQGAYFFSDVDIYFREIREATAQYTTTAVSTQNAQNPDAIPSASAGRVQPSAAPASAQFDPATSLRGSP